MIALINNCIIQFIKYASINYDSFLVLQHMVCSDVIIYSQVLDANSICLKWVYIAYLNLIINCYKHIVKFGFNRYTSDVRV